MQADRAGAMPAWLPDQRLPRWLALLATIAIVAAATGLRHLLGQPLQSYPTLLFFPAVFVVALLFDRACGFLATVLSACSAGYFFVYPYNSLELPIANVIPLSVFVVSAGFTVVVTDTLRRTAARLDRAERNKSLLLAELEHRTKNDLAIISSALTLQSRSSADPAVREALTTAVARVNVVAGAHDRLRYDSGVGEVDVASHLSALCTGLGDLLRGVRPIAVRFQSPSFNVSGAEAVTIGLIVNELVTNALKYAFPGERDGIVDVTLERVKQGLRITVRDDGVGCADDVVSGMGSKLVRLLAQQRGGRVERMACTESCHFAVTLAIDEDAHHA